MRFLQMLFILMMAVMISADAALALEPPERALSLAFNHPGLILGPDEAVELPLTIRNIGRRDDSFRLSVLEKPAGWEAEFRTFSATVTGVFLPGPDQFGLTLVVVPPEEGPLAAGEYIFKVKAESLDGAVSETAECRVTVRSRLNSAAPLAVTTSHPHVRGPSDNRFSFSLDVKNQGGDDSLVGLSASSPSGWEVYFKPSYEDKQVSSIQIPKGQSRTLTLDVAPGFRTQAGIYPIKVRAESKWGTAETTLTVELTGTYQIRLMMANELLSAAAEAGQPTSLNFFVINEGSAVQREVKFVTVAPDNWKVEFKPETIAGLEPYKTPTPVTVTITPGPEALAGDYGVGLLAEGERSKSSTDLRITVKASAAWAWLGAAIIVMVGLGLAITFRRLGRR